VTTRIAEDLSRIRRRLYVYLLAGVVLAVFSAGLLYLWWPGQNSISIIALVGLATLAVAVAPAISFGAKVRCPRCSSMWFSQRNDRDRHNAPLIWMLGNFRSCAHCGLSFNARANEGDA
jgi:hypothetical protein